MARLRLDVGLRSQGASLRTIGRELRDMDERKVTGMTDVGPFALARRVAGAAPSRSLLASLSTQGLLLRRCSAARTTRS